MNDDRFDRLATSLGRGVSRRRALFALFGGAASGAVALSTGGLTSAFADAGADGGQDICNDPGRHCQTDGDCCAGTCTDHRCGCPPGTTECNGHCRRCPANRVLNPQTCRCEPIVCQGAICGGQCVTCAAGTLLDTTTCQCVPATGCPGGTTACGSTCCGAGQTCVNGTCLCPAVGCTEPGTTVCANNTCCAPGQICNGTECCTPAQCPPSVVCGSIQDPCTGAEVNCGTCAPGYTCQQGQCVAAPGCGSNADCGPCQVCDPASGTCQPAPSGTVCAPAVCSGATLVTSTCDGAGNCQQSQALCPNGCQNGACQPACTIDADCPAGEFCSAGQCLPMQCQPGTGRSCYSGPAGTDGVGICHGGTQTCQENGTWGACSGEVTPQPETCNGLDSNCDGVSSPICPECQVCGGSAGCLPAPDGTACSTGVCSSGICVA